MIQRIQRTAIAASMALAAGLIAPAVLAQTQAPAQQAPATSASMRPDTGPAPTDAELQNFAHAAEQVIDIRKVAEPKLAAAKDQGTRTQLQQGAEKQMEAAIEQHHLSVQRYEQIAMAVQTDSTVRAKVLKLMQAPTKS